jgi:hypothetical protein
VIFHYIVTPKKHVPTIATKMEPASMVNVCALVPLPSPQLAQQSTQSLTQPQQLGAEY